MNSVEVILSASLHFRLGFQPDQGNVDVAIWIKWILYLSTQDFFCERFLIDSEILTSAIPCFFDAARTSTSGN